MAKIFVSVLKYDTQARQADSITARKKVIEDALSATHKTVAGQMKTSDIGRPVHCIFAAPEYMFANPVKHADHGVGDVRHLSEASKVSIEAWLEGLSLKYPKILLFPGSIAWKKPLERGFDAYRARKGALASTSRLSHNQLTAQFNAKVGTRTAKAMQAIQQNMATFRNNDPTEQVSGHKYHGQGRDVTGTMWYETEPGSGLGAVGWYGKTWTANPAEAWIKHAAPTSGQKLAELGGAGTLTKMARNTCLVYLNGEKLLKYHKQQDYHEVLDAKGDTVYVPGQTEAHFRTSDGVIYGLELCLDHLEASLQKKVNAAGVVPQVVVLMSAQVTMQPSMLPNPAAMAIHACSSEANNLVGRGGIKGADAVQVDDKPGYTLYSFDAP